MEVSVFFIVPSSRFQVPGSKFQVPSSRFQVPGSEAVVWQADMEIGDVF
jgi:hypothetical protein